MAIDLETCMHCASWSPAEMNATSRGERLLLSCLWSVVLGTRDSTHCREQLTSHDGMRFWEMYHFRYSVRMSKLMVAQAFILVLVAILSTTICQWDVSASQKVYSMLSSSMGMSLSGLFFQLGSFWACRSKAPSLQTLQESHTKILIYLGALSLPYLPFISSILFLFSGMVLFGSFSFSSCISY